MQSALAEPPVTTAATHEATHQGDDKSQVCPGMRRLLSLLVNPRPSSEFHQSPSLSPDQLCRKGRLTDKSLGFLAPRAASLFNFQPCGSWKANTLGIFVRSPNNGLPGTHRALEKKRGKTLVTGLPHWPSLPYLRQVKLLYSVHAGLPGCCLYSTQTQEHF